MEEGHRHACIRCGVCVKACRTDAIDFTDGKITVDESKCNFCGRCCKSCPTDAWDEVHGYIVSFGGLFGNHINKGEAIIPFIEDKEKLLEICDAAIEFFAENADAGERFKVIPHNYCRTGGQSDFLSDCIKSSQAY